MEREALFFMWAFMLLGGGFATGVGLAAHDPGMAHGALAATAGGLVIAPLLARQWRRP